VKKLFAMNHGERRGKTREFLQKSGERLKGKGERGRARKIPLSFGLFPPLTKGTFARDIHERTAHTPG